MFSNFLVVMATRTM